MIGLAGCFAGVGPVSAAERDLSRDFQACLDQAGGVTPRMIDCITTELKRQDDRLNQNYKKLMSSLSNERKKDLQEAQRAWLRFRDANCRFYNDPDGGTAARVEANDCILNATADRASELKLLSHD